MSAKSSRSGKSKADRFSKDHSWNCWLLANLFLGAVFLLLLFAYVFETNAVVAGDFKVKDFNQQISYLNGENSVLVARQSEIENNGFLARFAAEHNLIEAKNIIHLFEEKDVAMKK